MRKVNLLTTLLIGFCLLAFLIAAIFTYRLYKTGHIDLLISDKISVFSQIPGVEAEINNKAALEEFLGYIRFWDGVTPDNQNSPRNAFKPQKLVIHITDEEYKEYEETWYLDKNKSHIFSSKGQSRDKEVFHLYLGFNQQEIREKAEKMNRSVDYILFEALYKRTLGAFDQQGIDLRDAKGSTEPYIVLTRNNDL